MLKHHFSTVLVLMLCTFLCRVACAQETYSLVDAETGQAVTGAIVFDGSQSFQADDAGKFTVDRNIRTLRIFRLGYNPETVVVRLIRNGVIYLTPSLNLAEVEVSAYPLRQSVLAAPASYKLVTKQNLEINNQLDLANVLNNVPGVFMHSGTLGTNRITIRGIGSRTPFSTNKIRAYFGEIPLTAIDGESSFEDNEIDLLGNMEIVRGPAATAYGAGLGGLIKLSPPDITRSSLEVNYGVGSFGLSRSRYQFRLKRNAHRLVAAYIHTFADGYRQNSNYNRGNVLLNYQYRKKNTELDFLGTYIDVKGFIPSSLNLNDFSDNPSNAAGNWNAVRGFEDYDKILTGLTLRQHLGSRQDISATVYYTARNNNELRPFGWLFEESNLLGTRLTYHNQLSEKVKLAAGGEFTFERLSIGTNRQENREVGEITGRDVQNRNYLNAFAEASWQPAEKWTFSGGLNAGSISYDLQDNFTANGDQSGEYSFDVIWSPRAFAGYRYYPEHQAYLQVSHGFSVPSVEETLTPEGIINTSIRPETGLSYEAGLKGKISGLHYAVNGYHMNVKDLLVARRTAQDQFIGINAGQTSHTGTEIALDYRQKISRFVVNTFANFTFNRITFEDFIDEEEDFSGNRLPGVPDSQISTGVSLNWQEAFTLTVNYRHTGAMFLRDSNEQKTQAFSLLNIKLAYEKQAGRFLLRTNVGINNITNSKYASQILVNAGSFGGNAPRYYYPGNPRNYYGNISVGYLF